MLHVKIIAVFDRPERQRKQDRKDQGRIQNRAAAEATPPMFVCTESHSILLNRTPTPSPSQRLLALRTARAAPRSENFRLRWSRATDPALLDEPDSQPAPPYFAATASACPTMPTEPGRRASRRSSRLRRPRTSPMVPPTRLSRRTASHLHRREYAARTTGCSIPAR